jgi:hypothetical protein
MTGPYLGTGSFLANRNNGAKKEDQSKKVYNPRNFG